MSEQQVTKPSIDIRRQLAQEAAREDKASSEGIKKRAMDTPMVPLGIAAGLGMLGYMVHGAKSRKEKLSLYVIRTRMYVCTLIVGAMGLGAGYNLVKNYHKTYNKQPK